MPINVFIADDHTVVRDGLRLILEATGGISVVGEAGNGRDAVRQIEDKGRQSVFINERAAVSEHPFF